MARSSAGDDQRPHRSTVFEDPVCGSCGHRFNSLHELADHQEMRHARDAVAHSR